MQNNPETAFIHKTQAVFAASLEQIDPAVEARLREARRRAVASLVPHRFAWHKRYWAVSVGAMTAVVIAIAGTFWWQQSVQPTTPFATGNNEDMSIVLGNDNLDMYADLDFYSWLQTQQQQKAQHANSGGGNSG